MIKTYFAEKEGIDPQNIVVVSVMPCTACRSSVPALSWATRAQGCGHRHHHPGAGPHDQAVQHRFRQHCPTRISTSCWASPPGAGVIFSATRRDGAALRTAYEVVTGETWRT